MVGARGKNHNIPTPEALDRRKATADRASKKAFAEARERQNTAWFR
jgi:hypothetical protein